MFILMLIIFILGYTMIALEHPIKVDKAASALLTGTILWALYALNSTGLLELGFSPTWGAVQQIGHDIVQFIKPSVDETSFKSLWEGQVELGHDVTHFVQHELNHHLVEIAQILFFLLGAMTIVETVDRSIIPPSSFFAVFPRNSMAKYWYSRWGCCQHHFTISAVSSFGIRPYFCLCSRYISLRNGDLIPKKSQRFFIYFFIWSAFSVLAHS